MEEQKIRFGFLFAMTAAAIALGAPTAQAANERWCAIYSGRGGGGVNCGFYTLQQCRDTINLSGDRCEFDYMYRQEQQQKKSRAPYKRRPKN